MSSVGQLMGSLGSAYMLVVTLFAAFTTARALSDDAGDELTARLLRTISAVAFLVGGGGLVAFLAFMSSESTGSNSGMMSANMGLGIMFVFGAVLLVAHWVGMIVLAMLGAAIARSMRPIPGALVVSALLGGAPALMLALFLVQRAAGR